MGAIDFQRQMTETVYINLPGPAEPEPGMTGGELLHGFLAGLYNDSSPEVKKNIISLCGKWNIVYRQKRD